MNKTISNVKIVGLFKYLNYDIPFKPGINILHGINGKGKTTILNIITNIFNGHLKKFYLLSFKEITIKFTGEDYFHIYRIAEKNKSLINFDYKFGEDEFKNRDVRKANSVSAFTRRLDLKPLLLPAQRVSLNEANIDSEEYYRHRMYLERRTNEYAENKFQPETKMITTSRIKDQVVEKARRFSILANQRFSGLDNRLFEDYFQNVFFNEENTIEDKDISKELIQEIKELKDNFFSKYKGVLRTSKVLEKLELSIINSDKVTGDITKFLSLYLSNIKSKRNFVESYLSPFSSFEKIINELFDGKRISIKTDSNLKDIFSIKTKSKDDIDIGQLSSGEKNLLLIFYHFLFELNQNTFFMIDEPELSLHIDWQYHIIRYFNEYSKNNQILVVTHSPDILQGHTEAEINLNKCIIEEV